MDAHVLARPRHRLVRATVLAVIVAAVAVLAMPKQAFAEDPTIALERGYVAAINNDRADAGLAPLAVNTGAALQARDWAVHLMQSQHLAHDKNLAGDFQVVAPGFQAGAENVGWGTNPIVMHYQFVHSAAHRANMLGNFTQVGIGVSFGPNGAIWVVERFIR